MTNDAWRGRPTVLRITPHGLAPRPGAFVPAERLAGVEVRSWSPEHLRLGPLAWIGISLQLDDGTEVCAPSLLRSPAELKLPRRPPAPATVEWRSRDSPAWRALEDDGDASVEWSAATDEAVRMRIEALIRGTLRPRTESGSDS